MKYISPRQGQKGSALMISLLLMMAAFVVLCIVLNVQRQEVWARPESMWLDVQAKSQQPIATPLHGMYRIQQIGAGTFYGPVGNGAEIGNRQRLFGWLG